eukprot:CFRG3458T1
MSDFASLLAPSRMETPTFDMEDVDRAINFPPASTKLSMTLDMFDTDIFNLNLNWTNSSGDDSSFKDTSMEDVNLDMDFSNENLDYSSAIPSDIEGHLNSLRQCEPEMYSFDLTDSGINTPEPGSPLPVKGDDLLKLNNLDLALNTTSLAMFNLLETTNSSELESLSDLEAAIQLNISNLGPMVDSFIDEGVDTHKPHSRVRNNSGTDIGLLSIDPSMLKINNMFGSIRPSDLETDNSTISLDTTLFKGNDSLNTAFNATNATRSMSGIPPLSTVSTPSNITSFTPATAKLEPSNSTLKINNGVNSPLDSTLASLSAGGARQGLVKTQSMSSVSSLETSKRHQPYPKRNSERKRQLHNELERKRREDLNSTFNCLGEVIPTLKASGTPTQLQILKGAAVFLAELKERNGRLTLSKDQLTNENVRLRERLEALKSIRQPEATSVTV